MMTNENELMNLNENELDQINGGWSMCMFIGISSNPIAFACVAGGSIATTSDEDSADAFIACAYIGIGYGAAAKKEVELVKKK